MFRLLKKLEIVYKILISSSFNILKHKGTIFLLPFEVRFDKTGQNQENVQFLKFRLGNLIQGAS